MHCPVQNDNVARMQDHLAFVEFEADDAVQDNVEVRRRRCVHPRTRWISKLRQVLCDIAVEVILVAGRNLEDREAATARRGKAAAPSRLDPRVGEVRDIVPAPDNVEDDAIGAAVLDGICVVIADDARAPALIVPGDYSSNHVPLRALPAERIMPVPAAVAHADVPFRGARDADNRCSVASFCARQRGA